MSQEVSPKTAAVLRRMVKEGYLAIASDPAVSVRSAEIPILKLLVSKGLAVESVQNKWEPTEAGRAIDTSNASPDPYDQITEIKRQANGKARFSAVYRDKNYQFEVAEHENVGRGWAVRNVETDEIISCSALEKIKSL